jgi:hypothetical protein
VERVLIAKDAFTLSNPRQWRRIRWQNVRAKRKVAVGVNILIPAVIVTLTTPACLAIGPRMVRRRKIRRGGEHSSGQMGVSVAMNAAMETGVTITPTITGITALTA